jgi:hypothetical protein
MTNTDPKVLFDLTRETLENLGWKADVLGNTLTHEDMPTSKTRIHYTGGQIFIHGWTTNPDGTETTHWGVETTASKLITLATQIHKTLEKNNG